jgi:hypothetical protein
MKGFIIILWLLILSSLLLFPNMEIVLLNDISWGLSSSSLENIKKIIWAAAGAFIVLILGVRIFLVCQSKYDK